MRSQLLTKARLLGAVSLGCLAVALAHARAAPADGRVQMAQVAVTPPAQPDTTPDPTGKANPEMRKVLEAFAKLGPKPIEGLSASEARRQPSAADAVKQVLKDEGRSAPRLPVTTRNISIPGPAGSIDARVYTPEGQGPFPIVVYYHGGGFVIADLDVYDATPRAIADQAKAVVISSHYRQGPEDRFPAAHEDAFAAYRWVLTNAGQYGGEPARVAVMGESAGGNLAANVAIMARDARVQPPVHQVLVYPVAGNDMNTASYNANANAKPLNKAMMMWFVDKFIARAEDKNSPMLNLLGAELKGLPAATVITAELDPLRNDGQMLAQKLKDAGAQVEHRDFTGVTHEFFGMDPVLAEARTAQALVAENLKKAFASDTATGQAPRK